MAKSASDPVSAIAAAVGSGFDMVGAFVAKAAQRYGLQKSLETGAVDFEQQKTLTAYNGLTASRQSTTLIVIVILILFAFALYLRKK